MGLKAILEACPGARKLLPFTLPLALGLAGCHPFNHQDHSVSSPAAQSSTYVAGNIFLDRPPVLKPIMGTPQEHLEMLARQFNSVSTTFSRPGYEPQDRINQTYGIFSQNNYPGEPNLSGLLRVCMDERDYREVYSGLRQIASMHSPEGISILDLGNKTVSAKPEHGRPQSGYTGMDDPWYAFNLMRDLSSAAMMTAQNAERYNLPRARTLELMGESKGWSQRAASHLLNFYGISHNSGELSTAETAQSLNQLVESRQNWISAPDQQKALRDFINLQTIVRLSLAQTAMTSANEIAVRVLASPDSTYGEYEAAYNDLNSLSGITVRGWRGDLRQTGTQSWGTHQLTPLEDIPIYTLADDVHPFLRIAIIKSRGEAQIGMGSKGEGHLSAQVRFDRINMGLDDLHSNLGFLFGMYGRPYGLQYDNASVGSYDRAASHEYFRDTLRKIYYDISLSPEDKQRKIADFVTAWVWSEAPEVSGWGIRAFVAKNGGIDDPIGAGTILYALRSDNNAISFKAEKDFWIRLMGEEYCKKIGLID